MKALALVALVACSSSDDKPVAPPPPPAPVTSPQMTKAQLEQRRKALEGAAFDTHVTDTRCTVDIAKTGPDRVELQASDLKSGKLDTLGTTAGKLQTLIVHEAANIDSIYVWDRDSGKVVCKGSNLRGDHVYAVVPIEDTFVTPPTAMAPRTGKKVLQVAAGQHHTCVLVEGGTVSCFGGNDVGQADPYDKAGKMIGSPAQVRDITGAIEIATGPERTCARFATGSVTCWGKLDHRTYAVVTTNPSAAQLAIGSESCALRADHSVGCWGDNRREGVVERVDLPAVAEVCASGERTYARLADGGVRAWDERDQKPKVIGEHAEHLFCGTEPADICWTDAEHEGHCVTDGKAVSLPESKKLAAIRLSWDHGCLLRLDGTVACWGKNDWGQLGNGKARHLVDPPPPRPIAGPVEEVKPLTGVTSLVVGSWRTAVTLADGGLVVWGMGPIGDGRTCVTGPACDGSVPTQIPIP